MSQVHIEEGEAFVFDDAVEVVKLDETSAYRLGVSPLLECHCVDFLIRDGERLVFVEAKNYDRDHLPPGSISKKINGLPTVCSRKALGSVAVISRYGMRDASNEEFDWRWALDVIRRERAAFRLYVRLPSRTRYAGPKGTRQRERIERRIRHMRSTLGRQSEVGWLTSKATVVIAGDRVRVPGLSAIEPAPPALSGSDRQDLWHALKQCATAAGLSVAQIDGWTHALPDQMRSRMPVKRRGLEMLASHLDWLDADHAVRRLDDGRLALGVWLGDVVSTLLPGEKRWVDLVSRLAAV